MKKLVIGLLSAVMLVGCVGTNTTMDKDPIVRLKNESDRLNTLENYSIEMCSEGEVVIKDENNKYQKSEVNSDCIDYYQNKDGVHYHMVVPNNPEEYDYMQLYKNVDGKEIMIYQDQYMSDNEISKQEYENEILNIIDGYLEAYINKNAKYDSSNFKVEQEGNSILVSLRDSKKMADILYQVNKEYLDLKIIDVKDFKLQFVLDENDYINQVNYSLKMIYENGMEASSLSEYTFNYDKEPYYSIEQMEEIINK